MNKVLMLPRPSEALRDTTNSIHQITLHLQQYLPKYGWEVVESRAEADIIAGHAGQTDGTPVDVAHLHGLYPTQQHPNTMWWWGANAGVIANIRQAKYVTVPSEWVADIIRRDTGINPRVINWAIESHMWDAGENKGYVLWNKTRPDAVCDPMPMMQLAALAPDVPFVATFGDGAPGNVRITGRQPYEIMREYIRHAAVYLSTTKETFGIGTLEAMACGAPVLGFDWGANVDIVKHGQTGYLVKPGDIEGLFKGLRYCIQYRAVLGNNARLAAKSYTWDNVARSIATVYNQTINTPTTDTPHVSVIIPCHNYAQWVTGAIESVKAQETDFPFEIIVVCDRSTDDSWNVVNDALRKGDRAYETDFGGPALARNFGIERARGEFIVCLDADDMLGSERFLQTLYDALTADRTLGIAYTGLRVMNAAGELAPHRSGWPGDYDFDSQLLRKNQVPTCNMFRREAWRRVGGYRPYLEPAEDADLWLRMGEIGFGAKLVVDDGWFLYRMHGDSLSTGVRTGQRVEPDWTHFHSWQYTHNRPFAAGGRPENGSWAVRNYDNPIISVIIPVGPGHEFVLRKALDSVWGQSFWNWECIVANDTGKPLDLENGYAWVKVVDAGGRGAGAARNAAVAIARGQHVAFLDADDWLHPQFMEKTLNAFKRSGKYAYTDWFSINLEGRQEYHETPEYHPQLAFSDKTPHLVNMLLPRAWFNDVGGFDETLPAWEDTELIQKLAAAGYCGVRVPEPLFTYDYLSGNRRESSMGIQSELKATLYARYGEYMRGEKMCGCRAGNVKGVTIPTPEENNGESNPEFGQMIRVTYDGERAPGAGARLVGYATGANYGMRAKGDVFRVWEADYNAMKDWYFSAYVEYEPEPESAVEPPPPVLVGAAD